MVSPDAVAVVIRSGLTVTVITIKLEQGHSRGAHPAITKSVNFSTRTS